MKQSTKLGAVLILAGSTLDMSTVQAHVPEHKKATADVVANYIQGNRLNWNYSEQRKQQILAEIAGIRKQMREQAQIQLMDNYQRSGKLIDNLMFSKGVRVLVNDKEFK